MPFAVYSLYHLARAKWGVCVVSQIVSGSGSVLIDKHVVSPKIIPVNP